MTALVSVLLASALSALPDVDWFWREGTNALHHAERQMADGTIVYVPQGTSKYEAFWLRDYEMMLEAGLVPEVRIRPCAKVFLDAVSPRGEGVDCVKFTGEPIYKPGYGTMGENAVLDGCAYTVLVAYHSWRRTKDPWFLDPARLALLRKVLSAIPHDADALSWIDPKKEWDRCPWGFTDTVRKTGACLFSSLLEVAARRGFAEMLAASGSAEQADAEQAVEGRLRDAINRVFWDEERGLYRAATVRCREHDVMGSAYAVWLGVAEGARARRIAGVFRDEYDGLVSDGQVRHIPKDVYWEKAAVPRDFYQNGAYWGTGAGWYAWTLALVDREKAYAMLGDLRRFCARHGAPEWRFGDRLECLEYLSTLALPYQCLRRLNASQITIEPTDGNATPCVAAALKRLQPGDTLVFRKGEYHFFEEGAQEKTVKVGSTSWGEKRVVFGFEDAADVTIDGGGSTFVWHGNVFPFSFQRCRGVTVRNFTARAFRPSYVELKIDRYLDEGGFEFTFAPGVAYRVVNGALLVETDLGTFDSREKIVSVHALTRMAIHYLFVANETTDRSRLATSFLNGTAVDLGGGRIRIVNRHQDIPGCLTRYPFRAGEPLCLLLNGRERCALHFSECRDVVVRNVHLQGGDGMGIVSFLNENVTVDGYRVEPCAGDNVSITADGLFVVNNRGLVEVKNSTFSWALDDAINMHGNYLRVASIGGDEIELEHIHHAYYNFHPYHPGDTVEFTDSQTRDVLATAVVASVSERPQGAAIRVKDLNGVAEVGVLPKGTLVEDLTWVPEVRLHDNIFHDVLHVRLSGRGKYVVERNVFQRGSCLLVNDLAKYWGEAGRTGDMTIRDNEFDRFSVRSGEGPFVVIEVDGRDGRDLRIHRGIRITDNRVKGLREGVPFVSAPCALDPIIRDNIVIR